MSSGTKVCRNCGEEKASTPEHFHRDKHQADGLTSSCKPCRVSRAQAWNRHNPSRYGANMRRWRERNPDKVRRVNRATLLRQYGMTLAAYEELLAAQGGGCAICGGDGGGRPFHVDHDHACCPDARYATPACGKCVRGILCARCNHAIGFLGDDPAVAEAAALYLKEWRRSQAALTTMPRIVVGRATVQAVDG